MKLIISLLLALASLAATAQLTRLNVEVRRALEAPDMKERLAKLGAEPMAMSPEEFDQFLRQEFATLGEVMRASGVKAH